MSRTQRLIAVLAVATAWLAFALWQMRDYQRQVGLIHESLDQSGHAILTAVLGGIQSHRRLGPFFDEQLAGMLKELAGAKDVVAIGILTTDRQAVLMEGKPLTADVLANSVPGETWTATGYVLVCRFSLTEVDRSAAGFGPGLGRGRGFGPGGGRGEYAPDAATQFEAGKGYYALLVLDRNRADTVTRRSAWVHGMAVLAAALVAISLAVLWNVMLSLAEARGRARVDEAEVRHLRELNQAAAGLAHETRNPLGLIRGWTQRLAEPGLEVADRHQIATRLMEECDRVTARINQFLTFARPRSPDLAAVNVRSLHAGLDVILQPDLEERDVTLELADVDDDLELVADPEMLRQALFNLLQNAIQFAPSGQRIVVRTVRQSNGTFCIEVADSGPGVPEANIASLFTPYFTTRADGTGLGLAIVQHIARLHQWQVSYRRAGDRETVFSICGIHGT